VKTKNWTPARYQINKEIGAILKTRHPWIYRDRVSSAIEVFRTGQLLKLVDAKNKLVGFGLYDPEGLVAIRVLSFGEKNWDLASIQEKVDQAIRKRKNLQNYTDAFRLVHGENDGFPGVVIDVYGSTAVLQTYSESVDTLGRYVANFAFRKLNLKNLVWKIPTKRISSKEKKGIRVLRGHLPNKVKFKEGKMNLTVEIGEGQKSGTFLDLRALRKWVSSQNLNGKRVLNLFSYTGTLGLAAELAGAKEIWNVDISPGALETAKKNHVLKDNKHKFIKADIFDWIKELSEKEVFDLIIVDPPQMTSQTKQIPIVLKAYRQIYRECLKHLKPKGYLVGACCTSRVSKKMFKETLCPVLVPPLSLVKSLAAEDDHPIGFPEGDYLKVLIFGS